LRDSEGAVFLGIIAARLQELSAATRGKGEMAVLIWPHNRVEQLKKLRDAGLSASQIAAELGNVSRNAVIGKVHRLGLSGRAKSLSSAAPRRRKAHSAQQIMGVTRPIAVPMSQRLSLHELNEATCHWPIGDPSTPDFFFCGGKGLRGRSRARSGHL
jgi:GcrA cell cycle regulator